MKSLKIHSDDIYKELDSKFGKSLPFLISAKDLNGNVIFANDHFDILDGPKFGGFIGKNIYDLFPFEVAHELWMNDLSAIEGRCIVKEIERVKHSDGKLYEYLTMKMPLTKNTGEIIGSAAFSINLLNAATLKTLDVSNSMTELNSVIRDFKHELITPLNAIYGFSQLLREKVSVYQDETLDKLVEHIIDASEHMNAIIKKPQTRSNVPENISNFDLSALCLQCKNWVDGMALQYERTIEFRTHVPELVVRSSKTDIRQVILNLLTNAIKYTEGSSVIVINLSITVEKTVRVEVSNNGRQLSEYERLHIFDENFRSETHQGIQGNGLGLSIVKKKLTLLNCAIGVDCDESGLITFWFDIAST